MMIDRLTNSANEQNRHRNHWKASKTNSIRFFESCWEEKINYFRQDETMREKKSENLISLTSLHFIILLLFLYIEKEFFLSNKKKMSLLVSFYYVNVNSERKNSFRCFLTFLTFKCCLFSKEKRVFGIRARSWHFSLSRHEFKIEHVLSWFD